MNNNNLQPAPPLVIDMVVDLEPGIKDWYIQREAPNRGKIRVEITNGSTATKWYKITVEELDKPPCDQDRQGK